jgi:prevent-host-death family protein
MRTAEAQTPLPLAMEHMKTSQLREQAQVEQIPITKARAMISRLVNRVHVDKERIVLEKSGMPVAALIDIEEFKQFLAFQEKKQK